MQHLKTKSLQKEFLIKAERRAEHHGRNVDQVVATVVVNFIKAADNVHGSLYNGNLTGRSGWAEFGDRRVWCGYNKYRKQIEVRENNRLGRAIVRFDNLSRKSDIARQIRALRP